MPQEIGPSGGTVKHEARRVCMRLHPLLQQPASVTCCQLIRSQLAANFHQLLPACAQCTCAAQFMGLCGDAGRGCARVVPVPKLAPCLARNKQTAS